MREIVIFEKFLETKYKMCFQKLAKYMNIAREMYL